MTEKLNYGLSGISMDLGRMVNIDQLNNTNQSSTAPDTIVRKALEETSIPLGKFITQGCSVAIIVSDYTRPTGSDIYIPILFDEIKKLGAESVTIIIALGLHRTATDTEIEVICGGKIPYGVKVINHDAENNLSPSGDAEFNRDAINADLVITTGAVTFHPMAGFSGGRKSLLPGIASSRDIYRNHKLYFKDGEVHKGTGPANIDNNPVLNDIRKRTQGFVKLWSLNVVLNEQNEIEFASCGKIDSVWDNCRRYAIKHHSASIKEKYDMVISSAGGYPSDHSFYQSMKVLTNASRACKPGGTLIIVSQCMHGWEIRKELFSYFTMNLEEISQSLDNSFTMDGLALYMALSIIRSYNVWLLSDLPEKEVIAAGMIFFKNLDQVFETEYNLKNISNIKAAIIHNGSSTLPISSKKLMELF